MKIILFISFFSVMNAFLPYDIIYAHCDSMDGPVVADARKAIDSANLNFVLKWIKPEYEKDLRGVYFQVVVVRSLSPESEKLADQYFFETAVKLHRIGEGIPFTYIKPSGTPIDPGIMAADRSIEKGDLTPMQGVVPEERLEELELLFKKVMALKNFDVNDLAAGRAYVEAYVNFFHFAENNGEHSPSFFRNAENTNIILPWTLAGLFLITSLILLALWVRKKGYSSN